jgi:DNA helicase-2/ATP-dependent DNA helicase PcrA
MTPLPKNLAVIAAAGASKTQFIVTSALQHTDQRILIVSYTNLNLQQIKSRVSAASGGVVPPNITLMSWYQLMLNQCARPYQASVLGKVGHVKSVNFASTRSRFAKKTIPQSYFLDSRAHLYSDGVSDFCCTADLKSGGKVINRLESLYDRVYIDEVQDLAGYDLDFLSLLFASSLITTIVGDPRQFTYATNFSSKNKKYRGLGLIDWIDERSAQCAIDIRVKSQRCCQQICDFADKLFPEMEGTIADNAYVVDHQGIFSVKMMEVHDYIDLWQPTVIRWNKNSETLGQPALNVGVTKGSTYDRVLIFPTPKWLRYFQTEDLQQIAAKEKLYVAVTRARYSVTFVVP